MQRLFQRRSSGITANLSAIGITGIIVVAAVFFAVYWNPYQKLDNGSEFVQSSVQSLPTVRTVPPLTDSVGTPDQNGNNIQFQVNGYAVNPLLNNLSSNYDYYIFDIYAIANPGSSGWSVDTSGLSDGNGPSLSVTATLQDCPALEVFSVSNVSDLVESTTSGSQQVVLAAGVNVGGVNAHVTDTFTPPESQTQAVSATQCSIHWESGVSNYSPFGRAGQYDYHFLTVAQVVPGQPVNLAVSADGNFFHKPLDFSTSHSSSSSNVRYSSPPIMTIQSSPSGSGFVQVDGQSVATPYKVLWNEYENHTVSAAPLIQEGNSTCLVFTGWSDGGLPTHSIEEGVSPTTISAMYQTMTGSACHLGGTNSYEFLIGGSVLALIVVGTVTVLVRRHGAYE